MFPRILVVTLLFLISFGDGNTGAATDVSKINKNGLLSIIEDKIESKISDYVGQLTNWLEDFNDKHLGASQFGRFLHYNEMKPKFDMEMARTAGRGRMKKMGMAMMPLIFQLGATSTWMVLTSILTAKSVAIGLVLLVFKIAVSSAKLASFFTLLKGKHHDDHHGWSISAHPHYEHHGHDRSFTEVESHVEHQPTHHSADWNSYQPEWTPDKQEYHTIPESHRPEYNGPYLPVEETSKDNKF